MSRPAPGPGAPSGAAAYVTSLLALLGNDDPLEVMAALVPQLERTLEEVPAAALERPEAAGKWSVLQVVRHLIDTEFVYGYRLRLIVAEDRPAVQAIDQDRWAARLRHEGADLAETLGVLRALRGWNLRLLRSLTEAELDRVGVHAERGPESARLLRSLIAAHDLVHRRQVGRILAAGGR